VTGIQSLLDRAVAEGDAPFLIAMVGDSRGILWHGAAGQASPQEKADGTTLLRIFSMSKAVGATAAMILMERGKLSPDTPVADLLPDFAALKVLEGFDGDSPRLRSPRTICTVRHLATHTSGLAYEFWSKPIAEFLKKTGHPSIFSGLRRALCYPLVCDPGTAWVYGGGIDWLGLVVEAVDGRPIERFCQEEIFEPLGMADTRFELAEADRQRLAAVHVRNANGSLRRSEALPPSRPEVYGMGHCLYSTTADYLRFLRMYLNRGTLEGKRIMSPTHVEAMLGNQIGQLSAGRLVSVAPGVSCDFELFPGLRKTHSMAFQRLEDDAPGMRRAGSQGWAGVLNTHYWIDPASDRAALLMTQLKPFADPRFLKVLAAFERAVYALE
jgi:CubicO group peptidase (beta-lactamase class C family)